MRKRNAEFSDLPAPDPVLLRLLNEGATRGYTTLHRKDAQGRFEDVAALPVDSIPELWGQLISELESDSYASIQLMFRRGHGYARKGLFDLAGNQLHKPHRNNQALARLNAVYVDIDCYQFNLTAGEILGQLYDAQAEGRIPAPSCLLDSGRGLWPFWLLDGSNKAWPEEVQLWREIMLHLQRTFAPIGADAASTDAARISRIPGSVNRKAQRRVNLAILAGPEGIPRYSLPQLAEHFGIEPLARKRSDPNRIKQPANQLKGHRGTAARWQLDERRFWYLVEQLRDGVREGSRNRHCLVLGAILSGRYPDKDERRSQVIRQARRLWARFIDRKEYDLHKVIAEISKAAYPPKGTKRIKYSGIASLLAVTESEALDLAAETGRHVSKSWPTADGPLDVAMPLTKKQQAERIRNWIRGNAGFARTASSRTLAKAIGEIIGIEVSPNSAAKYRDQALPPQPAEHDQGRFF